MTYPRTGGPATPPAPAKQWPARLAAGLGLAQTAVLLASALCAWWKARSAVQPVVAGTYENMLLYSVVMAPLFLVGGIWLLRGRGLPSRVAAISVAATATVCCIGSACLIDFTSQSPATDALMRSGRSGSVVDGAVGLVADGWLLTPGVSMLLGFLLAIQISWDRAADARLTVFLGSGNATVR